MPAWQNPTTGQTENLQACVRCGFCCLHETCEMGQMMYGITRTSPCPELSFDSTGRASCGLVERVGRKALGIGVGCCIKARCYRNGVVYQFAELPEDMKLRVAASLRAGRFSRATAAA